MTKVPALVYKLVVSNFKNRVKFRTYLKQRLVAIIMFTNRILTGLLVFATVASAHCEYYQTTFWVAYR